MGKMSDFAVLMVSMVEALFAFFVVAPCILNAVSLFGVQKRFANVMVDEGIVKLLHPKKQIAGVLISVLVLGVLVATCIKTAPMGYLCGGVALVAGFLKYRRITQYNSLTVKRSLELRNIKIKSKELPALPMS